MIESESLPTVGRSASKPDARDEDEANRRPFSGRLFGTFGQHPGDLAVLLAVVLGGGLIFTYALDLDLLESILLMLALALALLGAASAIFRR